MASEQLWFLQDRGKELGPFSPKQLKQLTESGRITPEHNVRMGNDGDWIAAAKVNGLFREKPKPTVTAYPQRAPESTRIPSPPPQAIAVVSATVPAPVQDRSPCPFCREMIASSAVKCRHCNEFLDGRPREYQQPPQQIFMQPHAVPAAPAQHVNVVVNQHTNIGSRKRWSALVAMFLSFIIPGLGQLYKGQFLNGLVWFIVVIVGYVAFIVPGIVLHVCCVLGAGLGDPDR